MSKKILWFDNDAGYIEPFVEGLREKGYDVTIVTNVTNAERSINGGIYDLLILDVMIPIRNDEEEKRYSPEETDLGYKTGLVFYQKTKAKLEKNSTQVLALSIRQDKNIVTAFQDAGLIATNFATKFDLRDFQVFVLRIRSMLGD